MGGCARERVRVREKESNGDDVCFWLFSMSHGSGGTFTYALSYNNKTVGLMQIIDPISNNFSH